MACRYDLVKGRSYDEHAHRYAAYAISSHPMARDVRAKENRPPADASGRLVFSRRDQMTARLRITRPATATALPARR